MYAIPLLLSTMTGVLLGLIVQGGLRTWSRKRGDTLVGPSDDVFLGMLALAAFALGVLLTYVLLSSTP